MKNLTLILFSTLLLSSCCHQKKVSTLQSNTIQQASNSDNKKSDDYLNNEAYYFHTTESTYEKVQIKNGQLSFTFFKDDKSDSLQLKKQTDSGQGSNLKTTVASLTKPDIDSLFAKITRFGFWKLDTVIGKPSATERYYSFELSFKTPQTQKRVLFKSVPGGILMPDAFRKSRDLLMKLVREKMK